MLFIFVLDLDAWEEKILEDKNQLFKQSKVFQSEKSITIIKINFTVIDQNESNQIEIDENIKKDDFEINDGETNDQKFITIGMVGYPNVGKSSVINALMGKKVVSISRTPGHTKYFQTIFLTKDVCLCDCPGLVFPSLIDKPFQVCIIVNLLI